MKKIIVAVVILMVMVLVSCSDENTTIPNESDVVMPLAIDIAGDDRAATHYAPDGESTARLALYDDGRFALFANEYVSLALSGSYLIVDDKLILGETEHIFMIANDRLIFESGTWLGTWVEQGTEFLPIDS